ncbi:methyltransferase family protein [Dongia mobilis]|uniref:Methyltransferase family protein n=1 Tax=Dongia mobilis TaxID=578943 RepID=A0A4V3DF05_9PROT|nr:methyltransferase domain-containing protein [Dongia mobilis]TDQ84191.1 methyltransferase family protein [Dongia mobilis]
MEQEPVKPSDSQMLVFDRRQLGRQRRRALTRFDRHDFLLRELGDRLIDRLSDVRRRFPLAVDLSPFPGRLLEGNSLPGGIETVIAAVGDPALCGVRPAVICDLEALPFHPGSLDLALSCMGLHWVNDLPGALLQIRQALRPDGLFLGVMLGGETLTELRQCLMEAELAETGGASPRVAPMAGLRDMAGLLQRAGFTLPVADCETITLTYSDAFALMRDLRGMGEGNALAARRRNPTGRRVLAHAAALYQQRHAAADGRIGATIQAIFLTGWAPDISQQQPARRGSGRISLGSAIGASDQ